MNSCLCREDTDNNIIISLFFLPFLTEESFFISFIPNNWNTQIKFYTNYVFFYVSDSFWVKLLLIDTFGTFGTPSVLPSLINCKIVLTWRSFRYLELLCQQLITHPLRTFFHYIADQKLLPIHFIFGRITASNTLYLSGSKTAADSINLRNNNCFQHIPTSFSKLLFRKTMDNLSASSNNSGRNDPETYEWD